MPELRIDFQPESTIEFQPEEPEKKNPRAAQAPERKPGFLETFGQQGIGILKGAGQTLSNLSDFGETAGSFGLNKLLAPKGEKEFKAARDKFLEPSNQDQRIGKGIEQAAECFIPMGEAKLVAKAPKGLQFLARAAADALKTGAVSTVQTGDVRAGAQAAATAGGMSLVGAALAPAFSSLGRKIQASTIRPRRVDVVDGFNWKTLDKFKLKGNLGQSLEQVEKELARLRTERNALLAPGRATVDMRAVFADVHKEIEAEVKALKYAGQGQKTLGALAALEQDVSASLGKSPVVDIRVAENAKEFFGSMGSWAYGRPDPESKIVELVANKAYLRMKGAIEQALGKEGPQVQRLNKQMQELIPVKHAMLARLPVEERNRVFSLADMTALIPAAVTGDVRMLGLEAMSRAQKSLRFGNWLARNAGGTQKAAGGAGKLAGAGVSRLEAPKRESDGE